MNSEIRNIVVIGSGNVAFHMVRACSMKGIPVVQVLARNLNTARKISEQYNIPYTIKASELVKNADLYILAVQDDLIRETALSLKLGPHILVHTSGFYALDILEGTAEKTGVIWPLQTMTSGKAIDYRKVPFFIEGDCIDAEQLLQDFVSQISKKITVAESPARQQIHLAAVIASNLTNHLYSLAEKLLEKQGVPFNVLAPLILETARKAGRQSPSLSQTGPAVRNDLDVIEKHLHLLGNDPETREIYRMISENILTKHKS